MKNRFILLITCILLATSCKNEKEIPVDYIVFSGQITNPRGEYVIVYSPKFQQNIIIDKTGSFSDTLMIDKNGYYNYQIGSESSAIHLTKGKNIRLTIDATQFDESISYTGTGAENNTFLAEKYLFNEQFNGTKETITKLNSSTADQFKEQIDFQKNAIIDLLLAMKLKDTSFVNDQIKGAQYDYLSYVNDYLNYNQNLPKENNKEAVASLKEELKKIDIDNEEDFEKYSSFQSLTSSIYGTQKRMQSIKDTIPYHKAFFDGLSEIKSTTIKNALLQQMTHYISPGNPDSEAVYNSLMKHVSDTMFQKRITADYNKTKLLAKGNNSPSFDYENYKGGKTSLEDLKGTYVYIDVWATWCAPCIQEIPYLKELEKQYHGKNIEFVSISIDNKKDYNKWKEMIAAKELGGVQLFADNNWGSKFVQDYGINGIPRFILIDPDGKIVNASAPRPSSPILKQVFEGLKI